jgi:hypothetical protein
MFNLNNKNMTTIMPEEIQTSPTNNSINTMDMVAWWTKNGDGNFDWMLYRQIIEAKRFSDENYSELKK